jgi:hypothetical protein
MSILASLIDHMTGLILQGYVNTAGKADFKQAQENVKLFLFENYGRLERWVKQCPGKRPPVYFNSDTGDVLWLTRSQHRKLQRIKAKEVARSARA